MSDEALEINSLSTTLKTQYPAIDTKIQNNLLFVKTDASTYVDLATHLKERGFTRCLTISTTDWLEQNEFEIYYLIHHMKSNIYVKVATRIPRSKPEIMSLSAVWESAAMHEREMWELFGITFVGNTMLKPLFLEDWKRKPPLRKDFNWHEYVNQEYFQIEEE